MALLDARFPDLPRRIRERLLEEAAGNPLRAWHRAAASAWPSEAVASELEAAAKRARRCGAVPTAITGLERAAHLSGDASARGRRLLATADLAYELGQVPMVLRLLDESEQLELTALQRVRVASRRPTYTIELSRRYAVSGLAHASRTTRATGEDGP